MKIETEQQAAEKLSHDINSMLRDYAGTMKFMEVCGTHTMAIHSSGVKSLLNKQISLVSGPGCPVCVTEKLFIDQAMFLAEQIRSLPDNFWRFNKGPWVSWIPCGFAFPWRSGQGCLLSDGLD